MTLQLILKAFYSVMTIAVISMMWFYCRGLASANRGILTRFKIPFYGWVGALVMAGILFHLLTIWQLPWVGWEVRRSRIKPDREILVSIKDSQFRLPDGGINVNEGEVVKFKVLSDDLTYGFGVFREDGTMVFQMQVVPGHSNELIWVFSKPGKYSIRSTEYAGPESYKMFVKNAVDVSPLIRFMADKTGGIKQPHVY